MSSFRLTDPFFAKKADLVRHTVLPYQWEVLNDRIPGAESYCLHNFRAAARRIRQVQKGVYTPQVLQRTNEGNSFWPEDKAAPLDRFYGYVFQDSDIAKWLEAAAYLLEAQPDAALEAKVDEAVTLLCQAQWPDGYLNTFYTLNDPAQRFTNLQDNHELYCFGHLTEAAVALYTCTGRRELLLAMCRYADLLCEIFRPGNHPGYPGHPIAEMALVRLYEVTGKTRYLNLAGHFLSQRGTRPYHFDLELGKTDDGEGERFQYFQAHRPVREQTEVVGHAVRAAYLLCGMADVARLTEDATLKEATGRLWEDIVNHKLYVTGAIGSTHHWESFTYAYDLPNDLVYGESCASVGMAFLAARMLRLQAKAAYADILEKELYNAAISGLGLDGKSFFYVNPLEVNPVASRLSPDKQHVLPVRQKWFGCACCPPNIARLIASVGNYAVSETDDTVFVHLYLGGTFTAAHGLQLAITSGFPFDGHVTIRVTDPVKAMRTLALRLPGWCTQPDCPVPEGMDACLKDGYLFLTGVFSNLTLSLTFPMQPRILQADIRVREDLGKVCVTRGPLVYCLEEVDNGPDLNRLILSPETTFTEEKKVICGDPVIALRTNAQKVLAQETEALYSDYTPRATVSVPVCFIPYYAWANRGEGEMQVWTSVRL